MLIKVDQKRLDELIAILGDDNRHCASPEDAVEGKWTHFEITIDEANDILVALTHLREVNKIIALSVTFR